MARRGCKGADQLSSDSFPGGGGGAHCAGLAVVDRLRTALFGQSVPLRQGDTLAVRCVADIGAFPSRYRFDVSLSPGTPQERYFDGRTIELKM